MLLFLLVSSFGGVFVNVRVPRVKCGDNDFDFDCDFDRDCDGYRDYDRDCDCDCDRGCDCVALSPVLLSMEPSAVCVSVCERALFSRGSLCCSFPTLPFPVQV
jgi:hypothetical protein